MGFRRAWFLRIAPVCAAAIIVLSGCPTHPLLDEVIRLDEEARTVHAPVMMVVIAETDVESGSAYDLGEVSLYSAREVICTIENRGNLDLQLTGSPDKVEVEGTDAQDVAVSQPASPVAPEESTTFTVTFEPADLGERTATVSIANNDPVRNPYTVVFTVTCVPFAAPSDLTATTTSATEIHLGWTDNSDNETAFVLQRSLEGSDDATDWTVAHESEADAVSWDDSGLDPATAYYYRVKATNASGDSEYSSTATATTLPLPPAAGSDLTAEDLPLRLVRLQWSDNSDNETGFRIERSATGADTWTVLHTADPGVTSWDDTTGASGSTYDYRIVAFNTGGDGTASNTVSSTAATVPMRSIASAGDSVDMGDGEAGAPVPVVAQNITYSYEIARFEITNAQFAEFIDDGGYTTDSYWTANGKTARNGGTWTAPGAWDLSAHNGADQPVVGVSWYEAVAYCNWLSAEEGLTQAYDSTGRIVDTADGYRLPTEVEWEYAAAKGASGETERKYAWGADWDPALCVNSVSAGLTNSADVGSKSSAGDTPQGLVDMTGNAREWCSDNNQATYPSGEDDRYYFDDDGVDTLFMTRGGSYGDTNDAEFRSSVRLFVYKPGTRDARYGFRVVRGVRSP